MLIGIDLNGRITKVHILSYSETSAYLVKIDAFLAQFISKGLNDPVALGVDIDGITRATITSNAITRAVAKTLKEAGRLILQREASQSVTEKKPLPLDQIFVPLILFAVAVFGIRTHNQIARWLALLGGLLYFGMIKATMISAVQIVNISLLQLPSFEQSPLWYMLVGLTLLTTPLFGMVFCGSLCPFATVQELLYNVFHRDKRPKKHVIAYGLDRRARYIKYLVLFSVMIASILLGNSSAAGIEPYLTLFTLQATFWGWALLAFMLLAAVFYFRFWCKYFCPVGACLGLIARISLFKIKLGAVNCTHCELCDKTCPTRAIRIDGQNLPKIDHPECILCGKCVHLPRREDIFPGSDA
jgi:polyferredoxin